MLQVVLKEDIVPMSITKGLWARRYLLVREIGELSFFPWRKGNYLAQMETQITRDLVLDCERMYGAVLSHETSYPVIESRGP